MRSSTFEIDKWTNTPLGTDHRIAQKMSAVPACPFHQSRIKTASLLLPGVSSPCAPKDHCLHSEPQLYTGA